MEEEVVGKEIVEEEKKVRGVEVEENAAEAVVKDPDFAETQQFQKNNQRKALKKRLLESITEIS